VPSEGTSRKDKDGVQDGLRAEKIFCAKVDELAKSLPLMLTSPVTDRLFEDRAGNANGSLWTDDREDDRDMRDRYRQPISEIGHAKADTSIPVPDAAQFCC
jgi:hypothetical protein